MKWRAARDTPAEEHVVVANGDEGDPGAFIDRLLLEQDPHGILAGMLACARAIGARTGIVFVRAEYPSASVVMRRAIAEAELRGVLGDFRVEVICGAGSYVAGEESALLRAIEGMRAEPRPKPPFPAQSGLWGLPTVVQNVETLCVVPWVVRAKRKGNTKAFCVAGAVAEPGVVEAELGTRLRDLLERGAAGPELGKTWKMALVGGPMGRVVPRSQFDVSLDYDTFPGMGHGGIVVLEDEVPVRALAEHLFDFASSESCGNCAPCRIGTAQLREVKSLSALERLLDTLERGSLCGFGQGVQQPLRDLIEHYGQEVLAQ
jgi:NADH:ubiquinone oxidoreductase subunit F (NADH-binding)